MSPLEPPGAIRQLGHFAEQPVLRRTLILFVVLLAAWLLWSGHYTPLLLSLGVASCAFVAWVAWRMGLVDREGVPIELLPRMLLYLPYLALEIVKANVDVARRIVSPRMPIAPRVFRTTASQKTDLGRTIYANSITLTPGTVTVGVDGDEFTVHALTGSAQAGVGNEEMNRRVVRVEGPQP
jgi:multicomponent Na+:H+ antiporter subunit E